MSLFAEYKKEREGKTVLETDNVLCVYSIDRVNDALYVEDIYVKKEDRKLGLAQKTVDHLARIARTEGLSCLIGSVCPSTNGADYSLKIMLRYGFRLRSSHENIIFLKKDI